jgi:peptide deformylase
MTLVVAPNPVLRQPAKPVVTLDKRILDIIADLEKTLMAAKDPQGVGLAAPQIGISLRIFLIRPTPRSKPKLFINPEIIKSSQRQQNPETKHGVYEGCLSIPDHYAPLRRSMSVTVKYQTVNTTSHPPPNLGGGAQQGESGMVERTETFTDFTAHIIQHEMDHLNGVLFIDRVLEQNSLLYHVKGKTWEEVDL